MTRVRFLGPDTDAYVASVERHAAEFEESTGIELDVTIVPSDLYFSNRIHHLLDGEDAADVYMSGPVLVWEHLAAGFVRPLDDLVDDIAISWKGTLRNSYNGMCKSRRGVPHDTWRVNKVVLAF